MRASATLLDGTTLPLVTLSGLTTPEKRTNSVPLSNAICFSPLTTKLPLGRTSVTVTPTEPLNLLLASASAFSSNLLDELASSAALGNGLPNELVMLPLTLPSLLDLLEPALVALVFSTILIVRISPTKRGRLSSNMGL